MPRMLFGWATLLLAGFAAPALAGDLDVAWEQFYDAEFELALETTDALLAAGTADDLLQTYVLRARCYARLGNDADAMDAFCAAVAARPDWNPDPTFSASEIALFRRALAGCPIAAAPDTTSPAEPEPATDLALGSADDGSWYTSKKFWLITGGTLLLLAIAGNADEGDDEGIPIRDVPDFPDPPLAPLVGVVR